MATTQRRNRGPRLIALLLDLPLAAREPLADAWGVAPKADALLEAMSNGEAVRERLQAIDGGELLLRAVAAGASTFAEALAAVPLSERTARAALVELARCGLVVAAEPTARRPRPAASVAARARLAVPREVAASLP